MHLFEIISISSTLKSDPRRLTPGPRKRFRPYMVKPGGPDEGVDLSSIQGHAGQLDGVRPQLAFPGEKLIRSIGRDRHHLHRLLLESLRVNVAGDHGIELRAQPLDDRLRRLGAY